MSYNVEAIGHLHLARPSKKYQLPRQPDFKERAFIELVPGKNYEQALEGLEGFSHIWILFWMHQVLGYKPKVRPPGIEGKLGVFATRSPHRPNPIGLSCVRFLEIKGRKIWIEGCDMLEGTPILDIKPYLAHQESYSEASMGWIGQRQRASVKWDKELYHSLLKKVNEDIYLDPIAVERRLTIDPIPSASNRLKLGKDQFEIASGKWRFKGHYEGNPENGICFSVEKVEEA